MSSTPLNAVVHNLATLSNAPESPSFFILDAAGKLVPGGSEPTPVHGNPKWQFTVAQPLTATPPTGWILVSFPFELYGKPDGCLCGLIPEAEAEQWSCLLESIHDLETERRTRDFEMNDLAGEVVKNYGNIDLLTQLPQKVNLGLDEENFWRAGLQLVAETTQADYALLALANDTGGYKIVSIFSQKCSAESDLNTFQGYEGNAGLTGQAITEGRSVMAEQVGKGKIQPAPFEETAKSLLAVPLLTHLQDGTNEIKGAIVLIASRKDSPLTADEDNTTFNTEIRSVAELIASQLASMMGNRALSDIRKEVNIAAELQRSLLPTRSPSVKGYDLAGRCQPARYAGGDYYGYLDLANGHTGCLILDVSGHNLGASLMLPMSRAAFNWLGKKDNDPGQILGQASSMLHGNLSAAELFITLFLVSIDPESNQIQVANAGHNPPLIYRADKKETEWLDVDGTVIGMLPESTHETQTLTLDADDILLLYTDGVTEVAAEGGEMFGEERLEELIRANAHLPAQDILETVYKIVGDFGDAGQDDITMVVIKKV